MCISQQSFRHSDTAFSTLQQSVTTQLCVAPSYLVAVIKDNIRTGGLQLLDFSYQGKGKVYGCSCLYAAPRHEDAMRSESEGARFLGPTWSWLTLVLPFRWNLLSWIREQCELTDTVMMSPQRVLLFSVLWNDFGSKCIAQMPCAVASQDGRRPARCPAYPGCRCIDPGSERRSSRSQGICRRDLHHRTRPSSGVGPPTPQNLRFSK